MNITLRQKILLVLLSFTLIAIIVTSGLYYFFLIKDIRELSYKQITIAFDMMLDDFTSQIERTAPQLEGFIADTLAVNMSVAYNLLTQLNAIGDQQDSGYLAQFQTLMSVSRSMISEVGKFAHLIGIREFVAYDKEGTALAVYQHIADQEALGMYLDQLHEGIFIPLRTNEEVAVIWEWATVQDIPQTPLPNGILPHYEGEIPDAPIAMVSTLGKMVTLKLIVPMFQANDLQGVCVMHTEIRQQDVLRYSRFSQTEVNIFAGTSLSTGSLSDYTTLSFDESTPFHALDLLNVQEIPPVTYTEVSIGEQLYYQGKIVFGDEETQSVTITANFPRQIEKEKGRELIALVAGVTIVLGVFTAGVSFFLSSKIVSPITNISALIHNITQGNLGGILHEQSHQKFKQKRVREKDELDLLLHAFYDMVTYLNEMVVVAHNISQGEIRQDFAPRSEHDMLGQAFHQMSEYLREIATIATAIADRDFRQDIQPKSDHDILGTAFQKMSSLRHAISQIAQDSEHIRDASGNLNHISIQMASDTEEVSQKIAVISGTSQQINQTVNTVATAIEEFSASIREISQNTVESANIANTAVNIANTASAAITELESHSQEIGEISKVITMITQQTNLLALNATIEAARAGEFGRGFAVVANEVKTLAGETAISAANITRKIEIIQVSNQKVVDAIGEVLRIITAIHDISNAIASSVEQQSVTAGEIARNVAEAATGSDEVTEAIVDVSTVIQHTSEQALRVQKAAHELTSLADQLQRIVETFKIQAAC